MPAALRLAVATVDACRRSAPWVALAALVFTLWAGWFTATHLRMNTDTDALISAALPWKQDERAYDAAFPQQKRLLVAVIDGRTPALADDAAAALVERLRRQPALFPNVGRGDAPFLRQNGLLYEEPKSLRTLVDRLIAAQPLIGTLAADPSARGLFAAINLLLEGVARGQLTLDRMAPVFGGIAAAAEAAAAGRPVPPLDWQTLFLGREPGRRELRRFVLIQPAVDFGAVAAADSATAAVRTAIAELGLTAERGQRVRLTGNIAMEEEEFATVAHGMGWSVAGSLLLVGLILWLALRSPRLILPILLTLLAGLAATFAFAVGVAGTLNPISIAFAVLFIGMGVDFGIQVAVRYRDRRHALGEPTAAMRAAAAGIAGPLTLAAVTTAAGFLALLPTDFTGVSQLGLIAGVGMLIALLLSLTLLPALLTLAHPPAEAEPVGWTALAPLDGWLARRRRGVLRAAVVLALVAAAALPFLRFDFNPLNLRDRSTEAVATALDLIADPDSTPFRIQVLRPSLDDAVAMAARLNALPEVRHALTLASFVPDRQEEKLAILADAALLLGPSLTPPAVSAPPSPAELRATLSETVQRLKRLGGSEAGAAPLAERLAAVLATDDRRLDSFAGALTAGLAGQLETLATVLGAGPVTLAGIPADFARDWVTADGRARIEVTPAGDSNDPATMVRFVDAVQAVAPHATGAAVTIQESADVIVGAFRQAGVLAVLAVGVLLMLVLRRIGDTLMVLAPLGLAALLTAAIAVVVGLPLNFANIIALPLLTGAGVAFSVYYVVNWRAGERGPLASSTTRAIVYSALTTGVAFGSLAASSHPGTASMGWLLLLGLAMILLASVLLLPALLARPPRR